MKDRLISLIETALDTLRDNGTLPGDARPPVQIDRTKDKSHGDFATNIALMLAKPAGLKPRDLTRCPTTRRWPRWKSPAPGSSISSRRPSG
jgi:arginyl-tRNA synthetase